MNETMLMLLELLGSLCASTMYKKKKQTKIKTKSPTIIISHHLFLIHCSLLKDLKPICWCLGANFMFRAPGQIFYPNGLYPKTWSIDLNSLGVSWQKGPDSPLSLEKAHAVSLLGIHSVPYWIKGSTKPCSKESCSPLWNELEFWRLDTEMGTFSWPLYFQCCQTF